MEKVRHCNNFEGEDRQRNEGKIKNRNLGKRNLEKVSKEVNLSVCLFFRYLFPLNVPYDQRMKEHWKWICFS